MRFAIRPGKVTCAGLVVIFMVLPNTIWKGPDAKDQTVVKLNTRLPVRSKMGDSAGPGLEFRKVPR
jgi:hypothetical protein